MSKKRQRWWKELIIERIRKRHSEGLPLNSWDVRPDDSPLYQAARRYFGSWEAAIEATGLPYDNVRKAPAPYWSKELIIERIRKRHSEGLPLNSWDVRPDDSPLYQAACSDLYFGSWEAAVEAAGFDYGKVRKYDAWSKELIVERIRKRHSEGLSLSVVDMERDDSPLYQAACEDIYFGSWEAAIEATGLPYDDVRKAPAPYWSKELIVERIYERHRQGLSLNSTDVRRDDCPLYRAALEDRYFGSWEAAIEAAGIAYPNVRKNEAWSKELIIERIRRRHDEGLPLGAKDVQSDDSPLYQAASSDLYFGSWEAAVEAAGFSYPQVCKARRMKDLSRSSESEDRVAFLQNLGSKKKSRERNSRGEERE